MIPKRFGLAASQTIIGLSMATAYMGMDHYTAHTWYDGKNVFLCFIPHYPAVA